MPVKKNKAVKKVKTRSLGDSSSLATELAAPNATSNIHSSRSSKSPRSPRSNARHGLKADVYNLKGKVVETIDLPKEIFGAKINKSLISQAVRVYLANQRKGTASTKTRGEVKGSSRKIYKQKGTGRARHGSIRAPIFVKGGIVFGPKPRDYSLKLSKKMKRAALFSALSAKLKNGEIKILSGLGKLEPKTKNMAEVLKNLGIDKQKITLVLSKDAENIIRAARNIKNLSYILANALNTYQVLDNKALLFAKEAIEEAKKNFLKE